MTVRICFYTRYNYNNVSVSVSDVIYVNADKKYRKNVVAAMKNFRWNSAEEKKDIQLRGLNRDDPPFYSYRLFQFSKKSRIATWLLQLLSMNQLHVHPTVRMHMKNKNSLDVIEKFIFFYII